MNPKISRKISIAESAPDEEPLSPRKEFKSPMDSLTPQILEKYSNYRF